MIEHKATYPSLLHKNAFEKRDTEQLFDIIKDPSCINDLAKDPKMKPVLQKLRKELEEKLTKEGDPRMINGGDVFDSYPRFGSMRNF